MPAGLGPATGAGRRVTALWSHLYAKPRGPRARRARPALPGRDRGVRNHAAALPSSAAAASFRAAHLAPLAGDFVAPGRALPRRALPLGRPQRPRHRLLGPGAAGAARHRSGRAARLRHAGGAARRRSSPTRTPLARGDLVFWKGHVGIMRDRETLIHANGHHMAVAAEPLVSRRRAHRGGRRRADHGAAASRRTASGRLLDQADARARASGRGRPTRPVSRGRAPRRRGRCSAAISTASSRAPSAASATKRAKTHSSLPAQGQSTRMTHQAGGGRSAWSSRAVRRAPRRDRPRSGRAAPPALPRALPCPPRPPLHRRTQRTTRRSSGGNSESRPTAAPPGFLGWTLIWSG